MLLRRVSPAGDRVSSSVDAPAPVSVEHYGYAGTYKEGTGMIHGEIGKVGQFRIIIVPEMLHQAGGDLWLHQMEQLQVNGSILIPSKCSAGVHKYSDTLLWFKYRQEGV